MKRLNIKPRAEKAEAVMGDPWVVLLIDDDPEVIAITQHVLKGFSFKNRHINLKHADSCQAGIELIRQHNDAAVALIDVVMEKPDAGFELVDFIRRECPDSNIQLVIRTGHSGDAPELEVLQQYEITDYLHKAELDANRLQNRMVSYLRAFENLEELKKQRDASTRLFNEQKKILSFVSHELRGPLNNIHGILDFLDQLRLADSSESVGKALVEDNFLNILRASAETMLLHVKDLLDSGAIERGTLSLDKQPTNLADLLHKLWPVLLLHQQITFQDKSISVDLDIAKTVEDTVINIDVDRITQVITNIFTNALKYTDQGTINVTCSVSNNCVQITVKDTGVGMTASEVAQIFEPFKQLNDASGNYTNGIGLGLSIVKDIVELHHGEISVESEKGHGSVFLVTLPIE